MEALPVRTVRIRKRKVRGQIRREHWIKVSHHGRWDQRWRPFARDWWEKNVGPIPVGYQIWHRDGNSMNDEPSNLVLSREDRFRMILSRSPEARKNQQRRQAAAVAKSNQRRGRVSRSQLKATAWYLVLPQSRAIVWQPCRSKRAASLLVDHDTLASLCAKDFVRLIGNNGQPYAMGDCTEVVSGAELQRGSSTDGPFEGFIRLVPDIRRAPRKRRPKPADNLVDMLRAG